MKAGICSQGFERFGDERYKKIKSFGFSCVDFDMISTETEFYSCPEQELVQKMLCEKELADNAGITFSQVHGPWRWPPMDNTEEQREERLRKMSRSIRATALLGCKNFVIHPIMPFGIEDTENGNSENTYELNLEFMTKLLNVAKENDVTICLENMPMTKFSLARPCDILRFVKEMNDDHFKICLDTGHVNVFKDLSLYEETKRIGKELRVLHVHDNNYGMDLHQFPFFGTCDWNSFSKALKEIDFNGTFSLETVPPSNLPDPLFEKMCKILFEIFEQITN